MSLISAGSISLDSAFKSPMTNINWLTVFFVVFPWRIFCRSAALSGAGNSSCPSRQSLKRKKKSKINRRPRNEIIIVKYKNMKRHLINLFFFFQNLADIANYNFCRGSLATTTASHTHATSQKSALTVQQLLPSYLVCILYVCVSSCWK